MESLVNCKICHDLRLNDVYIRFKTAKATIDYVGHRISQVE
jgi:hypothetical protein